MLNKQAHRSSLILLMLLCGTIIDARAAGDTEEYVVYSAVVNALYAKGDAELVSISPHTADARSIGVYTPGGKAEAWRQVLPRLAYETLEDLRQKYKTPTVLEDKFDLKIKHRITNRQQFEERRRLARTAEGRRDRRIIHLTFSRVGFDTNKTQALVYVGQNHGLGNGRGDFVFLTKNETGWIVEKVLARWKE